MLLNIAEVYVTLTKGSKSTNSSSLWKLYKVSKNIVNYTFVYVAKPQTLPSLYIRTWNMGQDIKPKLLSLA